MAKYIISFKNNASFAKYEAGNNKSKAISIIKEIAENNSFGFDKTVISVYDTEKKTFVYHAERISANRFKQIDNI